MPPLIAVDRTPPNSTAKSRRAQFPKGTSPSVDYRTHDGVLAARWEVGPRIGIGGMASVHEGVDHRLGRSVAIKILHPHVAESAAAHDVVAVVFDRPGDLERR